MTVKLLFKILLTLFIIFLVICISFFTFIANNLAGSCGNTAIRKYNAPDNKFKIVVFERNCGATTDFTTQISLLSNDEVLSNDESGNIFSADRGPENAILEEGGIIAVHVKWINTTTILIEYDKNSAVYEGKSDIMGIHILYKPITIN